MSVLANLKGLSIPSSVEEIWARSTQGQKDIKAAQREHLAGRRHLVSESVRIQSEREKAVVAPTKTVTDAAGKFEQATQKLTEAGGALQRARAALQGINARADASLASVEVQLREGADPAIAEFVSEVRGTWDGERGSWATAHPNDSRSAGRRMAEIEGIKAQAEKLQLEVDPAVAAAELERLKGELKGAPA